MQPEKESCTDDIPFKIQTWFHVVTISGISENRRNVFKPRRIFTKRENGFVLS